MKVGAIVTPNSKGQIVIPKTVREELGINPRVPLNLVVRGGSIYLYPISDVVTKIEAESSYPALLRKTQGAWRGDTWKETEKMRKNIELGASKRRKQTW